MKRWLWWLCLGALLAGTRVAQADELSRAKELARRAKVAVDRGDYLRGAKLYAEAHDLVASARVKYNEGRSWELGQRPAAAADAYQSALEMEALSDDRAEDARRRLATLERDLGVLVVNEPALGRVDVGHAVARPIPARIHLAPGRHRATVVAPSGVRRTRVVEVAKGETAKLRFPKAPPAPPLPGPPEARPMAPGPDAGQPQRIAGWVMLALGSSAGLASIPLGALYLDKRSTFIDGGTSDQALHDEAARFQVATTATAITGAAIAAIGLTLVLTAPSGDDAEAAWVQLGPLSLGLGTTW